MFFRLLLIAALTVPLAALPAFTGADAASAATTKKKKKSYKRSDFTPEQRERILENARKLCKKKYGAMARVYRLEYSKNKVWCVPS